MVITLPQPTALVDGVVVILDKTAFLAYARARARVRGGANSRGGVKAVAPRTATRRRAATEGILECKGVVWCPHFGGVMGS